MNALWTYFWPAFGAGLVAGIVAGIFAFRSAAKRNLALAIGVGASLAMAALWHGPIGAAERFATAVEQSARRVLVDWEVPHVQARLHNRPLSRRLFLSGQTDDFQANELVRIFNTMPGVSGATWRAERRGVPLLVEGGGVAILGFLLGLFLAYLRALHRRHNSQWNW